MGRHMATRSRDGSTAWDDRFGPRKGSPLPPEIRRIMEARFGSDFGGVRMHTDELADASARALGARAYTAGSHIVFARGQYNPAEREGLWLLAHELAHVAQQSGGCPTMPRTAADAGQLESAANRAADLIVAGRSLPPDFVLGIAPWSVVQCHAGPPCTGFGIVADAATILAAERRIEQAYAAIVGELGDDVMYASRNFQPASKYYSKYLAFVQELQRMIRQRPIENRPNIINLVEREVYFFRRRFEADAALIGMIGRFHGELDRLLRKHGMATWASADSNWFPDHGLPLTGDSTRRFVCTQATDHQPPRGLILYDIRGPRRQRKPERRAVSYELWTADIDMAEFFPSLKAGLPNAVRSYDPDNSNFVFIVPAEFYYDYYSKKKNGVIWDSYRAAPSYDFPGGQAIKEFRSRLHHVSKLLGIVGLAVIVVAGSYVLITVAATAAAGAGAAATTGTAAGTSAVAGAGAAVSLPATTTVIAPAGVVVQTWAAGTAAATAATAGGGATAALWAVAAAPAAKAMAAASGVLLLIGTVRNANAGTRLPDKAIATRVSAFRAVPIVNFKPSGATQAASSFGPPEDFYHTSETAKGRFNVGTKVLFDNVPHIIIGGFSAS